VSNSFSYSGSGWEAVTLRREAMWPSVSLFLTLLFRSFMLEKTCSHKYEEANMDMILKCFSKPHFFKHFRDLPRAALSLSTGRSLPIPAVNDTSFAQIMGLLLDALTEF
jgi:hypothetical protein